MIRSRKVAMLAGLAITATAFSGGALAQEPVVGVPAAPTGYAELDTALAPAPEGGAQAFKDKKVSIQTQWIGGEGANFAAAVAPFEAATGIDIQIDSIGSSHETVLRTRIEGGAPPDLAVLAQPSGVVKYGRDGKLVNVASFADPAKLQADFPATIGLVTEGENVWGIPYKLDVKSVVWYPIKAFAAAGYEVPTTYDELIALSERIVADGKGNPWCIGMEAGTATGWQATDWVEDVVLRTAGIDAYNKWITGELKFDSPEIKAAFDAVSKIFFTPDFVFGGNTAIVATWQGQPMDPMFNEDTANPGCWMQKQATWYGPDFFPDFRANKETKFVIGEDIGLFYFPPIDPAQGTPALGSGDTLMVLAPAGGAEVRPEVKAVAEFLATPSGIETWIKTGSAFSANQNTPGEWYAGNYKQEVGSSIINNATSFGFDASDLMPPTVGAGSFWTEAVKWIGANGENTDEVLKAIDASWPAQ